MPFLIASSARSEINAKPWTERHRVRSKCTPWSRNFSSSSVGSSTDFHWHVRARNLATMSSCSNSTKRWLVISRQSRFVRRDFVVVYRSGSGASCQLNHSTRWMLNDVCKYAFRTGNGTKNENHGFFSILTTRAPTTHAPRCSFR